MSEKPDGPKCYFPRLEMAMRELDSDWHEALWELTGDGKSPDGVLAAVYFATNFVSQADAAVEYDVSRWAVRNLTRELIDRDYLEYSTVLENSVRSGEDRFGIKTSERPNETNNWEPPSV